MELITVDDRTDDPEYQESLCRLLEQGNILLVKNCPFAPAPPDAEFLRNQRQTASSTVKNIAYKPHLKKTTGLESRNQADAEQLHRILSTYSDGALDYMSSSFPHYAKTWQVDYASFRPLEEQGRDLKPKHRNDLMHVDAFPTRPTNGGRILRAFTNLHPTRDRVWCTSDPFDKLAERYAMDAGLDKVTGALAAARRVVGQAAALIGAGANRSPYDEFMIGFHHYLKLNDDFQKNGVRFKFAFPPGSTWISFTDQIAHKVTSGQYALEQTCIVPYSAMYEPEIAPVAILERLSGHKLVAA